MLSVSTLLLAVLASHPDPDATVLRASTSKSLNDFGSCFTRAQNLAARPWAFMPAADGGTFTNSGASPMAAVYWLRISESKSLNRIRLFAGTGSAELVEAVNRCR